MTGNLHAIDDRDLLRDYVQHGSDRAFGELVRRHVSAVYSAAMRRVNGERALAEDIAQQVFADLARKARHLPAEVVVGGWLHRHTGFIALKHLDRDRRRRLREKEAAAMSATTSTDSLWLETAPLLDEALDRLPEADRDVLVLRFFERKDFRAVGAALGVSDDTAQKRVARALEKLRTWLGRRGVTSTAGALAVVLSAEAVQAAPATLGASLTGTALATAASGTGAFTWWDLLGRAARWKLAAGGALAAGVLVWQQAEIHRLRNAAAPAASSPAMVRTESPPIPPSPSAPIAVATSPADAGHAAVVAEAARILRGGAQDVTATTSALAVLARIADGEIPQALQAVAAVADEGAQALLYKYLIGRWAESDPWAALNYVQKTLPLQCRTGVFEGVLTAWAGHDPESALAWFQKSRGSAPAPLRESLLATIFRGLGTRDLPAAAAQLAWLRTENERGQAVRGLLDAVRTQEHRDQLLSAAAAMEDEEARRQLRRGVVEQWVQQEPAAAAAYVQSAEPAHERSRLMDSLGLAWLQTDPVSAANWWATQAPGAETLIKIMNVWAHADPNAAGEWLGRHPAGPDSDPARMTFARQVADLDPESALRWAETIADSSLRESTIDHVFQNWRGRDSSAADSFLQKSTWPEDRVARLAASAVSNHQ
jgi:RNA polymerase sigma factor (sigma-70 family)